MDQDGKPHTYYHFQSASQPGFNWLHDQWYSLVDGRNVKRLPPSLEDDLTVKSLAIWYQEDGTLDAAAGFRLSTHCFTLPEQDRLCRIVKAKFGLECSHRPTSAINKTSGLVMHEMYFERSQLPRLRELILPYVVEGFLYKLGLAPRPSTNVGGKFKGVKEEELFIKSPSIATLAAFAMTSCRAESRGGLLLRTHCKTRGDAEAFQALLFQATGLAFLLQVKNEHTNIYIGEGEVRPVIYNFLCTKANEPKLVDLLRGYFTPETLYRLGLDKSPLQKRRALKG